MNKFCFVALCAVALAGCDGGPAEPAKVSQAEKAEQAADSIQFSENAEIDNIKRRLELTSNPGQIGFVLLMNEMGQPVMYASVKGKITSGGKRLTAPIKEWSIYGNNNALGEAPSDEGTWGHSGEYVYFWTVDGQYIQWNGKYLYSDKPFRTKIEPVVVNVN